MSKMRPARRKLMRELASNTLQHTIKHALFLPVRLADGGQAGEDLLARDQGDVEEALAVVYLCCIIDDWYVLTSNVFELSLSRNRFQFPLAWIPGMAGFLIWQPIHRGDASHHHMVQPP